METWQPVVGLGTAGLHGTCCESFVVRARLEVGPGGGLLDALGSHPFWCMSDLHRQTYWLALGVRSWCASVSPLVKKLVTWKGRCQESFSGTAGSRANFRCSCPNWSVRGKGITSKNLYFIYREDEFCHHWLNFSTWPLCCDCWWHSWWDDINAFAVSSFSLQANYNWGSLNADGKTLGFPDDFYKSDSRLVHHWYHTGQNYFRASLKEKK